MGVFPKKSYNTIKTRFKSIIEDFCRSDENSRICAGMKETVSVFNALLEIKEKLQKRILMYSFRDLYGKFVLEIKLEIYPKFSTFVSCNPKECVQAGKPGTHTICVCSQHENIRLKLSALNEKISYRYILSISVCSTENALCMLHKCTECPGLSAIIELLRISIDSLEYSDIKYLTWKTIEVQDENSDKPVKRVTLTSVTEEKTSFLSSLSCDIWNLTDHHFISEAQKIYLTDLKKKIPANTCIILMDYAENYAFIAQNSIQAFYFNSVQATLHPFGMYFKTHDNCATQYRNFCVISECLKHNATAVNTFIEVLMSHIKSQYGWIEKVIYFSDGAPSQYKNK